MTRRVEMLMPMGPPQELTRGTLRVGGNGSGRRVCSPPQRALEVIDLQRPGAQSLGRRRVLGLASRSSLATASWTEGFE
jgi:hypothetical protein